jgi:hypothetical protein
MDKNQKNFDLCIYQRRFLFLLKFNFSLSEVRGDPFQ